MANETPADESGRNKAKPETNVSDGHGPKKETLTGPVKKKEWTGPDRIVQNLTPKRIKIIGKDSHVLVLAPFEKERKLPEDQLGDLFPRLYRLELQNLVRVLSEKSFGNFEDQLKILAWGCGIIVGLPIYLMSILAKGNSTFDPRINPKVWLVGGVLFLVLMALGGVLIRQARNKGKGELAQSVLRWTAQALSLLFIVVLGIGLPSLLYYFFGGGRELLGSENSVAKLGRVLQLIFIFTAALLPALLYFLFDRQQLGTLRQRFEQQIFKLDPNMQTLMDVRAKYGRQIDEIYGRDSASGEGRLVRGTRWPILVATLVITLGWTLTLLPAGSGPDITRANQLIEFFIPQRTTVSFGFLGAYFFILNTVLNRYVRADLKPKAYSSITVRIFVVIILAWVIGLTFKGHNYELMVAFMIGVFPESALTLIRESIRRGTGPVGWIPYTKEKYPLTELEELDIYDRARLLDEGVTNVESLAHHDLIDLMLETRIPVPRLVDWMDQAILYLHVKPDAGTKSRQRKKKGKDPTGQDGPVDESQKLRKLLRENCIRTATDFIVAYAAGKGPLRKIVSADEQAVLDVLLETLKDEEWLNYVLHWRNSSCVEEVILDASSETEELGHISVSLKGLKNARNTYKAEFLLDPRATDSLAPATELAKIGVDAVGKTLCGLANGAIEVRPFGLAEISFMGEVTAGRVIFGPDETEPILGVTALESVGITIDPATRIPKRLPAIPLK